MVIVKVTSMLQARYSSAGWAKSVVQGVPGQSCESIPLVSKG